MTAADVFSPGSTALITGGASGIGLAIAQLCRSKGMNVVISDRNAEALEKAAKEVSADGSGVETRVLDVTQLSQWKAVAESLGPIELLVLNAGMGMPGGWGDDDHFRPTIEVNLFGVIHGINTFLSRLQESAKTKQTAIVVTNSKGGITNPPGNKAYNASKAASRSLAEQLSFDLRGTKTSVHLLVPGWTSTPLTGRVGQERLKGSWLPEQVAEYFYEKMTEDKFYIVCPDDEVTEEMDKKRMLWHAGDMIEGRPPLSRWRDEWKEKAAEAMDKMQV